MDYDMSLISRPDSSTSTYTSNSSQSLKSMPLVHKMDHFIKNYMSTSNLLPPLDLTKLAEYSSSELLTKQDLKLFLNPDIQVHPNLDELDDPEKKVDVGLTLANALLVQAKLLHIEFSEYKDKASLAENKLLKVSNELKQAYQRYTALNSSQQIQSDQFWDLELHIQSLNTHINSLLSSNKSMEKDNLEMSNRLRLAREEITELKEREEELIDQLDLEMLKYNRDTDELRREIVRMHEDLNLLERRNIVEGKENIKTARINQVNTNNDSNRKIKSIKVKNNRAKVHPDYHPKVYCAYTADEESHSDHSSMSQVSPISLTRPAMLKHHIKLGKTKSNHRKNVSIKESYNSFSMASELSSSSSVESFKKAGYNKYGSGAGKRRLRLSDMPFNSSEKQSDHLKSPKSELEQDAYKVRMEDRFVVGRLVEEEGSSNEYEDDLDITLRSESVTEPIRSPGQVHEEQKDQHRLEAVKKLTRKSSFKPNQAQNEISDTVQPNIKPKSDKRYSLASKPQSDIPTQHSSLQLQELETPARTEKFGSVNHLADKLKANKTKRHSSYLTTPVTKLQTENPGSKRASAITALTFNQLQNIVEFNEQDKRKSKMIVVNTPVDGEVGGEDDYIVLKMVKVKKHQLPSGIENEDEIIEDNDSASDLEDIKQKIIDAEPIRKERPQSKIPILSKAAIEKNGVKGKIKKLVNEESIISLNEALKTTSPSQSNLRKPANDHHVIHTHSMTKSQVSTSISNSSTIFDPYSYEVKKVDIMPTIPADQSFVKPNHQNEDTGSMLSENDKLSQHIRNDSQLSDYYFSDVSTAIQRVMVGEYLYKSTKTMLNSEKRKLQFVFINPQTNYLYWCDADPGTQRSLYLQSSNSYSSGIGGGGCKSAFIKSFRLVVDAWDPPTKKISSTHGISSKDYFSNHYDDYPKSHGDQQNNRYEYNHSITSVQSYDQGLSKAPVPILSIVFETNHKDIKVKATSEQSHKTWELALSYLQSTIPTNLSTENSHNQPTNQNHNSYGAISSNQRSVNLSTDLEASTPSSYTTNHTPTPSQGENQYNYSQSKTSISMESNFSSSQHRQSGYFEVTPNGITSSVHSLQITGIQRGQFHTTQYKHFKPKKRFNFF